MGWTPTIGKWNDEDNYNLHPPLWEKMLRFSAKCGDNTELRSLLSWLGCRNLYGYDLRINLIGCFLCKANVDLEKEFMLSGITLSKIQELSRQGDTLNDCAVLLLTEMKVSEEIIEELKARS